MGLDEMKKLFAVMTMVVGVIFAQGSVAQDNQKLTPAEQAMNQATIETAQHLAAYGDAHDDALALLVAARMLTSVPGRVLAQGEEGDKGNMVDISGMLDRAGELAKGDQYVTDQIGKVREAADESSRAICYWQYYCSYGWCQYLLGLLLIAAPGNTRHGKTPRPAAGFFRFGAQVAEGREPMRRRRVPARMASPFTL